MRSAATVRFLRDHPHRLRNAFLMMGYDPTPMRRQVHDSLVTLGIERGYDIIRADDRDYSGELWTNALVCLENCGLGIAVFDRNDQSAQNIAVELGYLFARQVPCLILREGALGPPPAMLAHRLHTPFDAFDLGATLVPSVNSWLGTQHERSARWFSGVGR